MFPYKSIRNATSQVLTACWWRFKPSGRLHSSWTALSCRRRPNIPGNVCSTNGHGVTSQNIRTAIIYTGIARSITRLAATAEKKRRFFCQHQCGQTDCGTLQAPNSTGARTQHKRSLKLTTILSVPCIPACLWCLVRIANDVSATRTELWPNNGYCWFQSK